MLGVHIKFERASPKTLEALGFFPNLDGGRTPDPGRTPQSLPTASAPLIEGPTELKTKIYMNVSLYVSEKIVKRFTSV